MKNTKVLLLLSIVSVLGSCARNNTSNTGKPTYTPSSITDNSTKEPEVVNVESVSITNKINKLKALVCTGDLINPLFIGFFSKDLTKSDHFMR